MIERDRLNRFEIKSWIKNLTNHTYLYRGSSRVRLSILSVLSALEVLLSFVSTTEQFLSESIVPQLIKLIEHSTEMSVVATDDILQSLNRTSISFKSLYPKLFVSTWPLHLCSLISVSQMKNFAQNSVTLCRILYNSWSVSGYPSVYYDVLWKIHKILKRPSVINQCADANIYLTRVLSVEDVFPDLEFHRWHSTYDRLNDNRLVICLSKRSRKGTFYKYNTLVIVTIVSDVRRSH